MNLLSIFDKHIDSDIINKYNKNILNNTKRGR